MDRTIKVIIVFKTEEFKSYDHLASGGGAVYNADVSYKKIFSVFCYGPFYIYFAILM